MKWLRRVLWGDYVELLEAERVRLLAELDAHGVRHREEVERFREAQANLRRENRQLVAALLNRAGYDIRAETAEDTPAQVVRRRSLHQRQAEYEQKNAQRARDRETTSEQAMTDSVPAEEENAEEARQKAAAAAVSGEAA